MQGALLRHDAQKSTKTFLFDKQSMERSRSLMHASEEMPFDARLIIAPEWFSWAHKVLHATKKRKKEKSQRSKKKKSQRGAAPSSGEVNGDEEENGEPSDDDDAAGNPSHSNEEIVTPVVTGIVVSLLWDAVRNGKLTVDITGLSAFLSSCCVTYQYPLPKEALFKILQDACKGSSGDFDFNEAVFLLPEQLHRNLLLPVDSYRAAYSDIVGQSPFMSGQEFKDALQLCCFGFLSGEELDALLAASHIRPGPLIVTDMDFMLFFDWLPSYKGFRPLAINSTNWLLPALAFLQFMYRLQKYNMGHLFEMHRDGCVEIICSMRPSNEYMMFDPSGSR